MTEEYQNRVRTDLTKVACEELSDVINRRARVAATVLDTADLTLMLTDIAASVLAGAITFGIQNAKDGHVDSLTDDIIDYVVRTTKRRQPTMLHVAAALQAGTNPRDLDRIIRDAGSATHG